jgi:protein involved in polysaccharide export with SLBB domain
MASFGSAVRALVPLLPLVWAMPCAGCALDEARPPAVLYVAQPATVITPPPKPDDEIIYLRGEFSAPGRYLLKGKAHVVQVIDAAGGLSPIADTRVIVSRRLIDGRLERWVVSTDAIRLGLAPDPEVEPEDVIDAIGLH